jgi:hypothetical protein
MFWREGDKGTKGIKEGKNGAMNEDTKEIISRLIQRGFYTGLE